MMVKEEQKLPEEDREDDSSYEYYGELEDDQSPFNNDSRFLDSFVSKVGSKLDFGNQKIKKCHIC